MCKSIKVNNQECKIRPKIVNLNSNEPVVFLTVFLWVNVVETVTISTILVLKIVFSMLLKMLILKCSI